MPAKPDPKNILEDALQLEPKTRAFIAETLLNSLDLEQDFPVTPEWLADIHRRCAYLAGESILAGNTRCSIHMAGNLYRKPHFLYT